VTTRQEIEEWIDLLMQKSDKGYPLGSCRERQLLKALKYAVRWIDGATTGDPRRTDSLDSILAILNGEAEGKAE